MAASARVERGSYQLNRHRANVGLLRGRAFLGRRFLGWELVGFQSLELVQAQRLARFYAQGLIGFMHSCRVCFLGSGFRAQVYFSDSGFRAKVCFFYWLYFQGQGGIFD